MQGAACSRGRRRGRGRVGGAEQLTGEYFWKNASLAAVLATGLGAKVSPTSIVSAGSFATGRPGRQAEHLSS